VTQEEKDHPGTICVNAGTLGYYGALIKKLEGSEKEQWNAIDRLRNRLPNWAVLVIAGLSGALGWTMQIAFG